MTNCDLAELAFCGFALLAAYLERRWRTRRLNSKPQPKWLTADLSRVPDVILPREVSGPMLPWYRRILGGGEPPEPPATPPPTYRG